MSDFELHLGKVSKIEDYRSEVASMRAANWPYWKVAEWLMREKSIQVSAEAVRQFCVVRGIQKSKSGKAVRPCPVEEPMIEEAPAPRSKASVSQQERRIAANKRATGSKGRKKFVFDESQPLQTRKNQES